MLTDFKFLLGISAPVVFIVGYIPYLIDIMKGRTKPHAFSWLIWGFLDAIAFFAQHAEGGGAGAWVTGIGALVSFIIFVLSLIKGERNITKGDFLCLIIAVSAVPIWLTTKTPIWSIVIVTIIDLVGFVPTFRKSYYKPFEETAFTYWMSSLKSVLSLLAMEKYSLVTVLYPASLTCGMLVFLIMLHTRRRIIMPTQILGAGADVSRTNGT